MDGKSRTTLSDVAAAAGVSKMTASRALRGAADVSESSAEKVRQAARDIGYVGNHLASSLSGQRSNLIGVIVPSVANIVFAEVLAGIADGIEGSGMQPVFGVTDYDLEKECDVIRNMLSWSPAGLIVTGLDQSAEARRFLAHADVPVVQILDLDGTPVDACVGVSHHAAGAAMADALIAKGRRRIGYVGCDLARDSRARKRLEGFKHALSNSGLQVLVEEISVHRSTAKIGRELTARALASMPNLDALYFSNDDLAAGGAFHCIASGISVPGRVTLAGFNGLDLLDGLPVEIMTSRTPRREIGRTAARYILSPSRNHEGLGGRIRAFTATIVAGA